MDPVEGWAAAVRVYWGQLDDLAKRLMLSIGRSAGYAKQMIRERFDGSHATLRSLDCPKSAAVSGRDSPASSAHCDTVASGPSLLRQGEAGLQAEGPDGAFYEVPVRKDCIPVHVGTVMSTLTHGAVPATPHRVLNTGVRRRSVGFFFKPALSVSVKPGPGRGVPVEVTYAWQVLTALTGYGRYQGAIPKPGS